MLSREPNRGLMKNKRKERKKSYRISRRRESTAVVTVVGESKREGLMVRVYVWVCWRVHSGRDKRRVWGFGDEMSEIPP